MRKLSQLGLDCRNGNGGCKGSHDGGWGKKTGAYQQGGQEDVEGREKEKTAVPSLQGSHAEELLLRRAKKGERGQEEDKDRKRKRGRGAREKNVNCPLWTS